MSAGYFTYDRRATFSNLLGAVLFTAAWLTFGFAEACLFASGFSLGSFRIGLPRGEVSTIGVPAPAVSGLSKDYTAEDKLRECNANHALRGRE